MSASIASHRPALRALPRLRKTMDISADKLRRARQILGARNDTQAIDQALDVVLANEDIRRAMNAAFGSLPDFRLS